MNPDLVNYIKSCRDNKVPDKDIVASLKSTGWQDTDIKAAFNEAAPSKTKSGKSHKLLIFFLFLIIIFETGVIIYQNFASQFLSISIPLPVNLLPNIQPNTSIAPSATTSAQPASGSANLNSLVADAHNALGFDLLQKLTTSADKKTNVFISPASIALALSMTYNGAAAETKTAMAQTMHLDKLNLNQVNQMSKDLTALLQNPDPDVQISIANSIWSKQGTAFDQKFLDTNTNYYSAEIQQLDFSQNTAADTINAWVAGKTNNKIPTIVGKPIDPQLVMFLINAIYFNGTWTYEFDPKLTQNKVFTLSDRTIQHPLMQQKRDDFMYTENDTFQGISLPYGKNKRLQMYVFLPKTSMTDFIPQITASHWTNWVKLFQKSEGILLMPKFKFTYDTSLKPALSALGMANAFSVTADFSLMRLQKDIFISDVKHKTYVDVNEKGTEAAAVTIVGITPTSVGPEKKTFYMEVNKPFLTAIADSQSGEILFLGIINTPQG